MAKPRITKEKSPTALFFAKLVVDKDDESMKFFFGSSIDTSGAPTPRANEYLMSE